MTKTRPAPLTLPQHIRAGMQWTKHRMTGDHYAILSCLLVDGELCNYSLEARMGKRVWRQIQNLMKKGFVERGTVGGWVATPQGKTAFVACSASFLAPEEKDLPKYSRAQAKKTQWRQDNAANVVFVETAASS